MPSPRQMALRRLKWCRNRADYTRDRWALFARPQDRATLLRDTQAAHVKMQSSDVQRNTTFDLVSQVTRKHFIPAMLDALFGARKT